MKAEDKNVVYGLAVLVNLIKLLLQGFPCFFNEQEYTYSPTPMKSQKVNECASPSRSGEASALEGGRCGCLVGEKQNKKKKRGTTFDVN